MLFRDTMIAWTPADQSDWETAGKVLVGPFPDTAGWSKTYKNNTNAEDADRKKAEHWQQIVLIFKYFHALVVRDGIDAQDAHEEFLKIGEYRQSIFSDISGHTLKLY